MKKILLLIISAITLTGCSNNDSENQIEVENESNEDELIVEKKDLNSDSDENQENSN